MRTVGPGLREELRRGLAAEQFSVVFQPEYDLSSSRIVAAEALARWNHPQRGEVLPDDFIGAAVQHGLIDELSAWVIDTALAAVAVWTAELGALDVTLRVNLSLAQLARPTFVEEFTAALARHHVSPTHVCVEITETAPLVDVVGTAAVVRQLRSLGVSVAIDDLASGFSTLGSLRWLPVDVVKIDRSLITGIDTDVRAVIILSAMITAARELDVSLVAEGVENDREAAVLLSLGCTHAQGNHLGAPMSGAKLLERLRRQLPPVSLEEGSLLKAAPVHPVRPRPLPRPR